MIQATSTFVDLPKSDEQANKEPYLSCDTSEDAISVERLSGEVTIGHGVDHEHGQGPEHPAKVVQVPGVGVVRHRGV